jgi:hypothetical protein
VAFGWGAAAFGELDGFSGTQLALLGGALVLVVGGVLVIVRSQDGRPRSSRPRPGHVRAAIVLPGGAPVRLHATAVTPLLAAGMVFGIGNLALLGLVSRVGTGVGFTIAQLSLLVNASIGIWFFKVPAPGSRAAKLTVAGILIAGSGGAIIGAMR